MADSCNDAHKGGREGRRLPPTLVLLAILLLGLALRLYQLGEQSLWYDEFISLSQTSQPDLLSCLRAERPANPDMVHAYFTLQYFWANWIGDSVISVRLMSILFGVLAIALIYLLARDLFGPSGGAVAALCLALSSVHIYQAQEIRYYSLTTLMALCTAYTFLRVVRGGKWHWWVLNALANVTLVWTHLFGCFLLVAYGVFLIIFRWRRVRMCAVWFCVNL
ncbi:MAG TPA: hypothetical protein ENN80_09705, partial [Candidatus Hydrogenedentes bacterium]|nr:hypothetical protein [Candidatus Hydrogenedentota bacterium]